MKNIIFIFFLLIMLPTPSYAEESRMFFCTGSEVYSPHSINKNIKYNIKLQYDDEDMILTLADEEGKKFKPFAGHYVSSGTMELSIGAGDQKTSETLYFVVTRKNGKSNSLIGTAYDGYGYTYTIRIDSWYNDSPFILFSSFSEMVIKGTCK